MRPCPYLIGLTGNIATGKSTIAAILAELGAHVIDADRVAHQVIRCGQPTFEQVVAVFGGGIVGQDGEIDRRALGSVVFADARALQKLERIVHPAVIVQVDRQIAGAKAQVIVVEAIKLIESGMVEAYDALWVTSCRAEQQVGRLVSGRGLSRAEAELRVKVQPPQSDKVARADVVIDTSGALDQTRQRVEKAWQAVIVQLDNFWRDANETRYTSCETF